MSDKVAELSRILAPQDKASQVAYMWDKFHKQRKPIIEEWKEQRNFVFATDTSTTSNSSLPWKNSTTLPKLCQIRDNLHSNYLGALFPNDEWLKWEAYSDSDADVKKAKAIQGYLANKTREGGVREELSKLLLDYIDYGSAFATVSYENTQKEQDGERIPGYTGPRVVRISPMDIVFNPLADFSKSWKIIRSIKGIGELIKMSEDEPDNQYLQEALQRRELIKSANGAYSVEDWDKAEAYEVDGFGNLKEYYESNYVEVLEFWGDFHEEGSKDITKSKVITVVDRATVIREDDIPSWLGEPPIYHVGWRNRPDNSWSMGPLANLVGMQYRIDHLENLKADAMDLCVHPPLVVAGEVEEFQWGPGVEIQIDENGSVTELGKNMNGIIGAQNEIASLEARMEQYAGAPSEAMGIRSPGEKTAFEVQQLQNKAGRIFQEKITSFEICLLEPVMNAMLEISRRNMDSNDIIRIMDDDVGVEEFISITKEDITARGTIRPIGARHFSAQAQLMQNLNQLYASPLAATLAPHTSGKAMTKLVEDALGLSRYSLFSPNIGVFEQQETAKLAQQGQEDAIVEMEAGAPNEEDVV